MNIKTIFRICAVLVFIQAIPLYLSLFSPEFKMTLISDAFGSSSPSTDAVVMFETFALVVGLLVLGLVFFIIGATTLTDLESLKRISFLLFVLSGFFALPDLIGFINGDPTAPLPVILLGLVTMGLFYYGSKKGTV
jgi:predicted membrane channel-forming protein YqfA (hemolysin III family)